MKRFLALLAFVLVSCTLVTAQGNGNASEGNAYAWGNAESTITWLQNGGAIPQQIALRVIQESRDWGMATFGLSLGQMVQRYNQGTLTIEFLLTAPPTLMFRVRYGGVQITVIIDDY